MADEQPQPVEAHPVALTRIEHPKATAYIVLKGTGNGVDVAIHIEPPAKEPPALER